MAMSVNEASAVLRAAVRSTIERRAMVFLVQGLVLMGAGALALIFPVFMSEGMLVLLGWLLVISAVAQAVSLIGSTQVPYFWLELTSVVVSLLVGWLLVSRPEAGLTAITLLMLLYLMVSGIQKVVFALMIRPLRDWGWVLGSGLVAIAAALILFSRLPEAATWLIAALMGVHLLAVGGAQAYLAWRLRDLKKSAAA